MLHRNVARVARALQSRSRSALTTLTARGGAKAVSTLTSAEDLVRILESGDEAALANLRVVDCGSGDAFGRAHVRRAARLPCDVSTKNPASRLEVFSAEQTAGLAEFMGVTPHTKLVFYDGGSALVAARAWWTFAYYGLRDVTMLDGGWPRYLQLEGPMETGSTGDGPTPAADGAAFTPQAQPALIASLADVLATVEAGTSADAQLVDARSGPEYDGSDLRGNRYGGHPPGAVHVPFNSLLRPDKTFKPPAELRAQFEAAGLDPAKRQLPYCQGGMRAAVVMLGLLRAGYPRVANYDGSMEEYNCTPGLPRDGAHAVKG